MNRDSPAATSKLDIFFWFSLFLCVFAVAAFSLRAVLDSDNLPPLRLSLVIHAVVSTLWLAYVPTQAYMATKRRLRQHRAIGWASVGLVIAVVISGFVINYEFLDRMQNHPVIGTRAFSFFFAGNVNFLLFFAFYVLGLFRLRDVEFHKRMMVFASVALLPPAFNRLLFAHLIPPFLPNVGYLLLMSVIPIHDKYKHGRISQSSRWAITLLAASILGVIIGNRIHYST